jgi:hypothetical protein
MSDKNSVTFIIGGEEISVPALTLWVLENCENDLKTLGPEISWTSYARKVVNIIACALDKNPDELAKRCTVQEMRNLGPTFLQLMEISGFEMGNAGAATADGTGTSNPSSPT